MDTVTNPNESDTSVSLCSQTSRSVLTTYLRLHRCSTGDAERKSQILVWLISHCSWQVKSTVIHLLNHSGSKTHCPISLHSWNWSCSICFVHEEKDSCSMYTSRSLNQLYMLAQPGTNHHHMVSGIKLSYNTYIKWLQWSLYVKPGSQKDVKEF